MEDREGAAFGGEDALELEDAAGARGDYNGGAGIEDLMRLDPADFAGRLRMADAVGAPAPAAAIGVVHFDDLDPRYSLQQLSDFR